MKTPHYSCTCVLVSTSATPFQCAIHSSDPNREPATCDEILHRLEDRGAAECAVGYPEVVVVEAFELAGFLSFRNALYRDLLISVRKTGWMAREGLKVTHMVDLVAALFGDSLTAPLFIKLRPSLLPVDTTVRSVLFQFTVSSVVDAPSGRDTGSHESSAS